MAGGKRGWVVRWWGRGAILLETARETRAGAQRAAAELLREPWPGLAARGFRAVPVRLVLTEEPAPRRRSYRRRDGAR